MASKIRKRNKHLNKENANKMSKTKFIKNNRDKFIYGIIIFLSILFIASIVYYGKNIPVGDDYQAVLKFGVDYKNSTTFSQKIGLIFEQHNEHRIVFVRLATLASIRLFGEVNFKFMLLLGGISILAILFILFQLFEIEKEKLLLFLPAALLLLQNEYYTDTFMAMASLSNLWVVMLAALAIFFATRDKFAWAAIFATLATFTAGNGILVFVALVPLFLVRKKYKKLAVWLVLFFIIAACYFATYTSPADHPNILKTIEKPLSLGAFGVSVMGASISHPTAIIDRIGYPISTTNPYSYILLAMGALSALIGLAILVYIIYLLKIKYYKQNVALSSFLLFLLLTVGVLTIGRAGFGLQQAFTSRYAHISILIIISCYLSAIEIYNEKLTEKNSKNKNSKKNKSKNGKMFRLFFIIFLILSIIFCAFQYVVTHSEIKKTITGYGIYDLCVLPKNTSIEAYKNSENYKMLHRWNNSSELDERLYQMNLITVKIINQSKTYGIYFAPDEICSKNYEKSTSK